MGMCNEHVLSQYFLLSFFSAFFGAFALWTYVHFLPDGL